MTLDANSIKKMELTEEDFNPLLSAYLIDGYKKDIVKIRRISVDPPYASASLDVLDYYSPDDGGYHFTSIHAMIVVSQIGIVLAVLDNQLDSKPGEIYMREFTILCRKKINKTNGIGVTIELARRIEAADNVLYDINYEFENKAFSGTLRCLFPKRQPEQ